MNELWNELAARAQRQLTSDQHGRLGEYLDLLLQANQTMNLTRIVDRSAAEVQHVGDALTVLVHLPAGACRAVDVGTGGGVPGIPLAIARPDIDMTLVEATQKKAAFLAKTIQQLRLKNVRVVARRAEDVGRSEQRESFDVALARAVGAVAWLAEWCLPLVKPGGKMLAMKGPRVHEELLGAVRALQLLGGGNPVLRPVELPGATGLLILEIPKARPTPAKYPRPASAAKGQVL